MASSSRWFYYSPLGRGGKWRMARDIVNLCEAMPMSVVVFSQEVRVDLEAGVAGRGSVGLLSGFASKVAAYGLVRASDPQPKASKSRR